MLRIGRYEVLGELGRGAMGVVYRARDPIIERTVAVKTMTNTAGLPAAAFDEVRARFLAEARAAGRLNHPGIVAVLDAGDDTASDASYIAMELVEGRDLASDLRAGHRFSEAEAAAIVAEAADALEHAHLQGIVHRDVKPANLMRDTAGRVKVADFGIARIASAGMTQTGQVLGSPAYMSPEQIGGASVDGRSDVFSLGVVLYELLTGVRPFPGVDLSTLTYQIVHTQPVPARERNQALSTGIAQVLDRALAKKPEDRYPRASDMAADLWRVVRGEGLPAVSAAGPGMTGTLVDDAPLGRTGTVITTPVAEPVGAAVAERTTHVPEPVPSRRRGWPWVVGAAVVIAAVLLGWCAAGPGGPASAPATTAPKAPAATTPPVAKRPPAPTPPPTLREEPRRPPEENRPPPGPGRGKGHDKHHGKGHDR